MSCTFEFSDEIKFRLEDELKQQNIRNIEIVDTGCTGLCDTSPVIRLMNKQKCYIKANVESVPAIIAEAIS